MNMATADQSKKAQEKKFASLCLRIPEVAEHLRLAANSVYKLIRSGQLRAVTICGKRRVRRIDLEKYLEAAAREADRE